MTIAILFDDFWFCQCMILFLYKVNTLDFIISKKLKMIHQKFKISQKEPHKNTLDFCTAYLLIQFSAPLDRASTYCQKLEKKPQKSKKAKKQKSRKVKKCWVLSVFHLRFLFFYFGWERFRTFLLFCFSAFLLSAVFSQVSDSTYQPGLSPRF